jgi:cytochrome c oxidase subunit 1
MAIAESETSVASPPWTAILHEWVTTVDHKKIGVMYILIAVLFLIIGGIEALVIRTQLLWPGAAFVSPDVFNQMMTMHGTTMIFFVAMPICSGTT